MTQRQPPVPASVPPSVPPDEGSGRAGARSRRATARGWWRATSERTRRWMDTWGIIVPAVGLLLITVLSLPTWLAASRDEGTRGTFTAVEEQCSGRPLGCEWVGTFRSDDGTLVDDEAVFDEGIDRPGDEVRAQAVGEAHELYAVGGGSWWWLVVADVASAAYVLWWVRVRRWRGPRSERRARESTGA